MSPPPSLKPSQDASTQPPSTNGDASTAKPSHNPTDSDVEPYAAISVAASCVSCFCRSQQIPYKQKPKDWVEKMQSEIATAKTALDMARKGDPDLRQVESQLVQSGQLSKADFRSALKILGYGQ